MTLSGSGIDRYYTAIQDLQARVISAQRDLLSRVAGVMADTMQHDGRIFLFGSGHSHMLAEEGFYRAGGLAPVTPIFSSALMLHDNAALSSRLERTAGLARVLLQRYTPRSGEMIFVYSNSGVNQMPVELAMEAKDAGMTVVAMSSAAYARVAPLSSLGKRLDEVADYFIDNGGEPGDGLTAVNGSEWRIGPSSTVIGALVWNALVVESIDLMQQRGLSLPVFASLNMAGAEQHNRALLEKWSKVNPHL